MTDPQITDEKAEYQTDSRDLDLFSNAYGWDLRSQHYGEGKEIQFIQDSFKTFKAFNYGPAWLTDGKSKDGFKDTYPVFFIFQGGFQALSGDSGGLLRLGSSWRVNKVY